MRALWLVAALCLAACNDDSLAFGSDGNPAVLSDLGTNHGDASLVGFCASGSPPRAEVNGILADPVSVEARAHLLNCCESAQVTVLSDKLPFGVTVLWRRAIPGQDLPVTFDLAQLPKEWGITVTASCDPFVNPGCAPIDQYEDGFTGTLTVARDGDGYSMSTCLQLAEPAATPHAKLHTFRLWSPTITAH